jgi:50S ribosomal protein L16 3-hydroxylase
MQPGVLGGLTPRLFLQRHWQKLPLFVKGALAGFRGVIDKQSLSALAMRDDAESRVVQRRGKRWETVHGPFGRLRLPARNASLLVSGVNLHLRAADELLRRFDFLPQARLDDVMVSFATPGGGVGPHVDSYDVFLLQGPGRRAWTVWAPGGSTRKTYVASPGDLLYLPPGWKHDGVALDACFTYSIGFRAPRGSELGAAFLDWLHERGLSEAHYRDPMLAPTRRPASIPPRLEAYARKLLGRIRWSASDVARFLGEYLTEPKPHVVFAPGKPGGALARSQVRLDPKTQFLYRGEEFFINGESFRATRADAKALRALADRRHAPGAALQRPALAKRVREWQRHGYLHLDPAS